MKEYKPYAIESIAQRELMLYNPAFVSGDPGAVDIEEMIELYYGIILQFRNYV